MWIRGDGYYASEEADRYRNFLESRDRVNGHNAKAGAGYRLGLNHMSDWSREELARLSAAKSNSSTAAQPSQRAEALLRKYLNFSDVPTEVDWRKVPSRVSPVDDQGQCVAGYAFATVGMLEGQQIPKNFKKLVKELGADSDADYPYRGRHENCQSKGKRVVMTVGGSVDLPRFDEEALKKFVTKYGPVATKVHVNDEWPYYKSGVYDNIEICSPDANPKVWMLVVGYGTNPKEGDYWIVKNFWSDKWGEAGYIRIRRGKGMCRISSRSTIVDFE